MASKDRFDYRALRFVDRAIVGAYLSEDWTGLVAARQRMIKRGMLRVVEGSRGRIELTRQGVAYLEELQHDLDVWGSL